MLKKTFTTKNIVLMGLLVAMSAALKLVSVWAAPDQKLLDISFLPLVAGAVMLGPAAALMLGLVSDTVNYIVRPMGAYFPGYALSLMVTCLLFAIWQFNKPIRIWRIMGAHFCNIVIVYFGLNYVWRMMLTGTAAAVFFTQVRLVTNAVLFPFMVISIYGMLQAVNNYRMQKNER